MIDRYAFGEIVVDGETYHADLILLPDRVINNWWREQGHSVCEADIAEVVAADPEVVIFGQGEPGRMSVPALIQEEMVSRGIEVLVLPTTAAVARYNDLVDQKRVAAALHLTC